MKIFANIPSTLLTGFSDMCSPVQYISEPGVENWTLKMYPISLEALKRLKIDRVDEEQLCVRESIYVDCWYVSSYLCAFMFETYNTVHPEKWKINFSHFTLSIRITNLHSSNYINEYVQSSSFQS